MGQRKALERCVTDGRVQDTALAVDKTLTEEVAAPRAGIQGSGSSQDGFDSKPLCSRKILE